MQRLRRLIDKVVRNVAPEMKVTPRSLRYLMEKHAAESTADYITRKMLCAEALDDRIALFQYIMPKVPETGALLEFGVAGGGSINFLASLTERTIHGFDSFHGLPSDGVIPDFRGSGAKFYAGKMDRGGELPKVAGNVVLHKGWFDETLDRFVPEMNETVALIHLDADIYSSTKVVLDKLRFKIGAGAVIIFDEYFNYIGWQRNAYTAFQEYVSENNVEYEYLAYTFKQQVAVRIRATQPA